jgi:hypothetical protein
VDIIRSWELGVRRFEVELLETENWKLDAWNLETSS